MGCFLQTGITDRWDGFMDLDNNPYIRKLKGSYWESLDIKMFDAIRWM